MTGLRTSLEWQGWGLWCKTSCLVSVSCSPQWEALLMTSRHGEHLEPRLEVALVPDSALSQACSQPRLAHSAVTEAMVYESVPGTGLESSGC